MRRVLFVVDGFNLYHALVGEPHCPQAGSYRKYRWLNLAKLAKLFLGTKDEISAIYYCTAFATWDWEKTSRHRIYIRALESAGVKPLYGKFKRRTKFCKLCRREYQTFEEKQTDVNIAMTLVSEAIAETYDAAVIVSGDSDLVPAIQYVKSIFPAKQIGVLIPITRTADELKNATDFHYKMRERHLASSQFPDTVDLGGNVLLRCPPGWTSS